LHRGLPRADGEPRLSIVVGRNAGRGQCVRYQQVLYRVRQHAWELLRLEWSNEYCAGERRAVWRKLPGHYRARLSARAPCDGDARVRRAWHCLRRWRLARWDADSRVGCAVWSEFGRALCPQPRRAVLRGVPPRVADRDIRDSAPGGVRGPAVEWRCVARPAAARAKQPRQPHRTAFLLCQLCSPAGAHRLPPSFPSPHSPPSTRQATTTRQIRQRAASQ
jgi:hypothetical protein